MNQATSFFDRLLSRPRPIWTSLIVSLLLISLPFLAAALDGLLGDVLRQGRWRVYLLPPTIVIYIWFVSPRITQMGDEVLAALRPLVDRDDEDFQRLVREASWIEPTHEWLAFAAGALLGIFASRTGEFEGAISWLGVYWYFAVAAMYGLLAWSIFISLVSTRLNSALHQEVSHFDILDPSPFEPVGRQSLLLALVFIGGITISFFLTYQPANLTEPGFWLANLMLVLLSLLIFFLSMRPTHKLMVQYKQRALEPVQDHIRQACQELVIRLGSKKDPGDLPARINALIAYETRLKAARTWPYNTATLRTLFFSVLIPLISVLGRVVVEVWAR